MRCTGCVDVEKIEKTIPVKIHLVSRVCNVSAIPIFVTNETYVQASAAIPLLTVTKVHTHSKAPKAREASSANWNVLSASQ